MEQIQQAVEANETFINEQFDNDITCVNEPESHAVRFNVHDNTLIYSPEYIESLSQEETTGTVRAMLEHTKYWTEEDETADLSRSERLAITIKSCYDALQNDFILPDNGLVPDSDGTVIIHDEKVTITDIGEKTVSEIQTEIENANVL